MTVLVGQVPGRLGKGSRTAAPVILPRCHLRAGGDP